jgi:hypothetical protein
MYYFLLAVCAMHGVIPNPPSIVVLSIVVSYLFVVVLCYSVAGVVKCSGTLYVTTLWRTRTNCVLFSMQMLILLLNAVSPT